MISKLFRLDPQRREKHEITPYDIKTLREMTVTHNITAVAVPKYRVRGNFVEYVVECSKKNLTWHVFRRYQQFKALDQKLKQLCSIGSQYHCEYGVLPVLAGSHWAEVTNQSVDLVEKRRRYLEIYLEQLLVPKNLFYVASPALYNFLHDGEVPVRSRANVLRPLIGFADQEPLQQQQQQQQGDGSEGSATPMKETPKPLDTGSAGGDLSAPTTTNCTAFEREAFNSVGSSITNASSGPEECDDVPSKEETDTDDIIMPPASPLCLQCNAEFSSMMYPHRCFLCKQRFCRNCLRSVELEEGVVRVCVQCHENQERHNEKKLVAKDSSPATLCLQPQDAAAAVQPLQLQDGSRLRTDVVLSDFELVTTLGRGTFGKVIKVIFRENGQVYAMKVLNKCIIHKRRMVDYIREEKTILALLPPHPYIVTCHFAFQTDYHLFFVFDFLPGGELYSRIYPKCTLSSAEVRVIVAEIVLALEQLHRYDIVHRDLKPENIVFAADGHLKLTDFGLARMNFSRHRRCSFVGSPEYIAPETILGEAQTAALDWWSVGVMMYEMLRGSAPFHAANNNEVCNNVLNLAIDFSAPCFTPEATSLIRMLLQRQPKQRLCDAEQIKAHPYFASLNWSALEKKAFPPPIRLNLEGNDTKYFKREFTAEWAVILKPHEVSRATLDILKSRFSNFVYVLDTEAGASSSSSLHSPCKKPPLHLQLIKENADAVLNAQKVLGVWRLVKVEMTTDDGKIAYPWGGEVCGLLAYFPNGLFTMQLTLASRRHTRVQFPGRATMEGLVDMYNSYVASFGRYQLKAEGGTIVHLPDGGLSPNLSWSQQKYFVEVIDGKSEGDVTVLKLFTAAYKLQEEKLLARTFLTWERVEFC
ncbi:zinc finger protein kinase [Trypanosoma rangeli]|uniref:Zinc finger protein kinase n=1 Tax=Trypanosoma rangeli TaxID=5698 RepID=A0A3R7N046_TRYRA|nr:zinc finger protein kinase [Trypanosoma rangeli]RNF10702.1 zinc finger protein kinase [Trypanosoma rangeli]|eukprot:RNF10702.1 zinc finger protein kinase [Trypanosoma rangeli]